MTRNIEDFINRMIVDSFEKLDISRIHVLEKYCNIREETLPLYDRERGRIQAYRGFINGWYSMMNGLNAGAGITPYRSIK